MICTHCRTYRQKNFRDITIFMKLETFRNVYNCLVYEQLLYHLLFLFQGDDKTCAKLIKVLRFLFGLLLQMVKVRYITVKLNFSEAYAVGNRQKCPL